MAKDVTRTPRDVAQPYAGGETTRPRPMLSPRTDIYETEGDVVVVAEMPGVGPDDVDVSLERRVLTIRGHVLPDVHEGYRQVYAEYGPGDYERVFTVSEDIDQDRIKATQSDGVLTLVLPKAEPAKAKRIKVKAA